MKLCVPFVLIFFTQAVLAQFRYADREYPDNHIDSNGRRQGKWIIYDVDNQLINEIIYKNDIPDSTVYFDLREQAMILQKPDIQAKVIAADQSLNPSHDKQFLALIFKCRMTVSCLVYPDGSVSEIRLIGDCPKKAQQKLLRFVSTFKFDPAQRNGVKIISQCNFNYGRGM